MVISGWRSGETVLGWRSVEVEPWIQEHRLPPSAPLAGILTADEIGVVNFNNPPPTPEIEYVLFGVTSGRITRVMESTTKGGSP
jgi:hypothetical protein